MLSDKQETNMEKKMKRRTARGKSTAGISGQYEAISNHNVEKVKRRREKRQNIR